MKSLILAVVLLSIKCSLGQNTTITNVNLFLVKGNSISTSLNVSWDKVQQIFTTDYDITKKSVIFLFGWMDNLNSSCVSTIIDAYSKSEQELNVFILDWSKYTMMNYFSAVWRIPDVALYIVSNFKNMMSIGYDFNTFHLIGFSLGAQLSGYIGRYMQSLANFTLPRITGLDPAGPLFYPTFVFINMKPLMANDSRFVDVIHTNAYQAGGPKRIGHIDFYPNGGTFQPGCPQFTIDDCNHQRSWQYYAESVTYKQSDKKFQGVQCNTFKLFSNVLCTGTPIFNYMGYYANPNNTGSFFLNTTAQSPFSL
ncbi:unnamed protein product [Chironomus riparius]|uniref:Lipase domain-containing protein n=1 Tax=Chironomus riparius TaxID=315576 RepID=A0A9N9RTJ0_9DIPT|nr:unnamed protein product [Chironomus riparius]